MIRVVKPKLYYNPQGNRRALLRSI
jgi:hypothetical protein